MHPAEMHAHAAALHLLEEVAALHVAHVNGGGKVCHVGGSIVGLRLS